MDITTFIKTHKELSELPFLVVFSAMSFLKDKKMLKGFDDVD